MPLLSSLRRSRAGAAMVALATLGFFLTAGAFGACGSEAPAAENANDDTAASTVASAPRTPRFTFEVVTAYPHDTAAFTQGLQWLNGKLYEGTGEVGHSDIREVDLTSGRVLRRRPLPPPHFGEGIVVLNGTLYQLTWQTNKAFSYDAATFTPRREFTYEGEGWGLTTDGASLVMSNGSSVIAFRDPVTFTVQRTIEVTENGTPVSALNELEWVKGELWANVWQTETIARIDPATGKILGWIDLRGILSAADRSGREDVLNGIAFDAERNRYFVTGKRWSKLFEITLAPRP